VRLLRRIVSLVGAADILGPRAAPPTDAAASVAWSDDSSIEPDDEPTGAHDRICNR
jgi:hypothetical protein